MLSARILCSGWTSCISRMQYQVMDNMWPHCALFGVFYRYCGPWGVFIGVKMWNFVRSMCPCYTRVCIGRRGHSACLKEGTGAV